MSTNYKCLKVFLCSAQGTLAEEKKVKDAIVQLSRGTREHLNIEFQFHSWRDIPPTPGEKGKQEDINEFVKTCDIFILLLFKRYGSFEKGQKRTNLEREVDEAIERYKRKSHMKMLTYFRDLSISGTLNEQEKGVLALKKKVVDEIGFYQSYKNPAEFASRIVSDLYGTLLEIEFNTGKHKALKHFWRFGLSERKPSRKLVIVYPGMDRAYMRLPDNDGELWLRRLVPNIVYEDHRALQKVEKVLQHIRMTDYYVCTQANLPEDWRYMNRCWVCVPRNKKALDSLSHMGDAVLFKFCQHQETKENYITWKHSNHGKAIDVHSPLTLYLRKQRDPNLLTQEWNKNLRDIVARDYAVLARFPRKEAAVTIAEGQLMEYFIGGIRGLGTWGAAWFIDHNYNSFLECKDWSPFQKLLEITYVNGRIETVVDVSNKSESYFESQMDPATIDHVIEQFAT